MVPIVKIENDRGEVLDFSTSPRYVAMLTGTGPPAATINRAKVSVADGTRYNSATVNERELLLTVHILRDIARARLNLYRFIATKSHVKIYYQADGLDVFIEGYVETVEVNPWEQNQNVQVSIICPMPFWQDVRSTHADASQVQKLFEFPFYTDCITRCDLSIYGKTVQNGTPSPAAPVAMESAGDNGAITITAGGQSMDIPTPNGLPGIPVDSGGNYTDENGQQWVCDEVDFTKGVYVQRIQRLTLTGNETWHNYYPTTTVSVGAHLIRERTNVLCNYLTGADAANTGYIAIRDLSKIGFADVNSFKTFLQDKYATEEPAEFLYILETPTETALPDEVLEAYTALGIGGNTSVAVSDGNVVRGVVEIMDAPGVELSSVDMSASTMIENNGTVEAGVTFVITATVRSENPRIHNLSTGEFIGVHATLEAGDQLEICTVTGSKRVTHIRNGVRTNYINTLMLGSKWLQMAVGANEYSYTVDIGECELGVYHTNMYTGV